jgi:hypothetical protein
MVQRDHVGSKLSTYRLFNPTNALNIPDFIAVN